MQEVRPMNPKDIIKHRDLFEPTGPIVAINQILARPWRRGELLDGKRFRCKDVGLKNEHELDEALDVFNKVGWGASAETNEPFEETRLRFYHEPANDFCP